MKLQTQNSYPITANTATTEVKRKKRSRGIRASKKNKVFGAGPHNGQSSFAGQPAPLVYSEACFGADGERDDAQNMDNYLAQNFPQLSDLHLTH